MLWMINRQQKHIEALLYQTWHQLCMCVGVFAPFLDTWVSLARQFYLQLWGLCVTYCMSTQTHTLTHTILTIIMSVTAFLFFSLSILNTAWLSSSHQGLLLVLFSQRSRQSLVSEREKDQPNNMRHWNLFFFFLQTRASVEREKENKTPFQKASYWRAVGAWPTGQCPMIRKCATKWIIKICNR